MARQTVVLAYERLASEGYVRARTGSGTYVAPDLPDAAPAPAVPPPTAASSLSRRGQRLATVPASAASRDAGLGTLLAGGAAPDLFPKEAWARCAARVLKSLSTDITGYPPPQGLPELRGQIAAHLAATRGLLADPANIVVTAGTQQALRIAAELLLDPGDAAWVEDPGYIAGRGALLAAGAVPVPVLSDSEGLDVAAGIQRAPEAAWRWWRPRTPRRWAARYRSAGAWHCSTGRAARTPGSWRTTAIRNSAERHPLPPLATLDRVGRVIYCGTFSKTLAPALRLGFAVVPAPLVPAFVRLGTLMDRGIDTLNQAILAEFMRQGLLSPHVRRMRTEYARRRVALLAAIARHAPSIAPIPAPGGLHMVGRLSDGMDEAAAVQACRARGLAVSPLGAYYAGPPRMTGLVMGFAGTPTALATDTARRLEAALRAPHDRKASKSRDNGLTSTT